MVMPNIGAFIAWGLMTAFFIPSGWWPNEHLAKLVEPSLKYLLPLLIAYTAGKNIAGDKGGVTGAIAAIGIIAGTDIPMFLGAMIMGPLGGVAIKWFDKKVSGKVAAGFEMLVNNFSVGIIGMLLAIAGFMFIGDAVTWLTDVLAAGTQAIIDRKLLPLVALIVEPGKVLFLNNAINHGVFDPVGISQASEAGKSIMFLIETNPGPGLGLLLACWMFGKGSTKQSAPGAVIIHFFGGIHEIFFPYVLSRPILILSTIAGSVSGLLFFSIFDCGLVAPASPGSIISILAMAPKGETLMVFAGVMISAAVALLVAAPLVRTREVKEPVTDSGGSVSDVSGLRSSCSGASLSLASASRIIFACDAGMGSSALGATRFRRRVDSAGLKGLSISNCAADSIPEGTDVVVCQKMIADRLRSGVKGYEIVQIDNFLSDPALDSLFARLSASASAAQSKPICPASNLVSAHASGTTFADEPGALPLLKKENILTGLPSESKEAAILRAGRMLTESGYVEPAYSRAMVEREELNTTYIGMGIAIPHGTNEAKKEVLHSGIVVLQYPEGVDFGSPSAASSDEDIPVANLVIGIAGVGNDHLAILAKLGEALEDDETAEKLRSCNDKEVIYNILNDKN